MISFFELILLEFNNNIFLSPIQCLIKSYLDVILIRLDPDISLSNDNIHNVYQNVLSNNHELCSEYFNNNNLEHFLLYKYAIKSFQTQPHLALGLLASLCSSEYILQKKYIHYFIVMKDILQ